jgi:hypothetical protein
MPNDATTMLGEAFMLLVLPMCSVATGVVLMIRSERVASQWLCKACGYDLRGSEGAERCPECGTKLNELNTIMPGQVLSRNWQMWIGTFLLWVGMMWCFWGMLIFIIRLDWRA